MSKEEIQNLEADIASMKADMSAMSDAEKADLKPILDGMEADLATAQKANAPKPPKKASALDGVLDDMYGKDDKPKAAEKPAFKKTKVGKFNLPDASLTDDELYELSQEADFSKHKHLLNTTQQEYLKEATPSVAASKKAKPTGAKGMVKIVSNQNGFVNGEFEIEVPLGFDLPSDKDAAKAMIDKFVENEYNWEGKVSKIVEDKFNDGSDYLYTFWSWQHSTNSSKIYITGLFKYNEESEDSDSENEGPKTKTKPTPSVKSGKMGKLSAADMSLLGDKIQLGCALYPRKNTTNQTWIIETVVGDIMCGPGEYVMYLKGGYPFTVMQANTFEKRCLHVAKDEKVTIQIETPTGDLTVARVNDATGDVESKKKKPLISKEVEKLAAELVTDPNCDEVKFLEDVKGTPIDDSIWEKIVEFNTGKTTEKISRIGVNAGQFIVEVVDLTGFASDVLGISELRYYKVCGESGKWTLLKGAEEKEVKTLFVKRQYRSQYSKDEMRRYYNYGDPAKKQYDEKLGTCKTLSQEAYKAKKDTDDRSEKFKTYFDTCRNQAYTKLYKNHFTNLVKAAIKHKETYSVSYKDAMAQVRSDLKKAIQAKKAA